MKNSFLQIFSLALLMGINLNCNAQSDDLIKKVGVSYAELNKTQQAKYNSLSKYSEPNQMFLVKTGLLNDALYDGTVTVNLPFLKFNKLRFQVGFVQYKDNKNYEWFGNPGDLLIIPDTIKGTPNELCTSGGLTLTCIDGRIFGDLVVESDNYLIVDLSGEIQVLFKKKISSKMKDCGQLEFKGDPTQYKRVPSECVDHKLRLLILYTAAAQNSALDPVSVASTALTQMRGIWNNSQIIDASAITIAAVLGYNMIESSDLSYDLHQVFVTDQTVQAMRDNYHADLVVLLTNGADYSGIGEAVDIGASFNTAYAIVQIAEAVSENYVFVHEVGHLLGARHDLDMDPNPSTGHGHHIRGAFNYFGFDYFHYRTIMAYAKNNDANYFYFGEPRIPYFSNPDVNYLGNYPTGSTNENNAGKINENIQRVEDYYTESLPDLNADLIPDPPNFCGETVTAKVYPHCGTPPYSYQWFKSTNGILFTPINGITTDIVSVNVIPSPLLGNIFIRSVVTDANSSVITKTEHIYIPRCCPSCLERKGFSKNNNPESNSKISLTPNPTNTLLTFRMNPDSVSSVRYEIYNSLGEIVATKSYGLLTRGEFVDYIDTKNLSEGVYFFKLYYCNKSEKITFVVKH